MYPNEITDPGKNSINRILRYDEIAGRYNPEISDPVKDLFRQEADSEDFEVYFHVWRQMFQKHPAVYLQATLNNTYGYFYPNEPGKSEDFVFWGIKIPMQSDLVQITNPQALDDARSTLFQLIYTFRVFPGISMFGSIGFHVWILILAFMFLLSIRQYRFITVLLPSIFSLFVCLVSPINTYSRYAWPIIFLTPLVICVCFYAQKSLRINNGH
jgi:hypothetical protein